MPDSTLLRRNNARQYTVETKQCVCKLTTTDNARQYTIETKQCVSKLLNHNVPTSQIAPVIESVLKMAGKKASDFPSKSTVNDWNIMRLIMARTAIRRTAQKDYMGLLSDEMSKFGQKFEGFHPSDSAGRMYVLGLCDIALKSGQDGLSTFQQILCDITYVSLQANSEISKKILLYITCIQ